MTTSSLTALTTLLAWLVTVDVCDAQTWTPVLFDREMTVAAGATIPEAAGEMIARAEDRVVPHRFFEEHGIARRTANMTYRFFKLAVFDVPQEDWLRVANHEVFGHGGRIRERFDSPISYTVPPPPPYGRGGGVTSFSFDREPSLHEVLAITAGGMEANNVAGADLAIRSMSRDRFYVRDAIRYLEFQFDTINYILDTGDRPLPEGHDVGDFIDVYNEMADLQGGTPLTARTLRRRVLLSFANPLLASAVYTIAVGYVWRGDLRTNVPAFSFWGIRYLPLARFHLAPFGTEWVVDNLIRRESRTFDVAIRGGEGPVSKAFGTGVRGTHLASPHGWEIGGAVDVWRQPEIELESFGSFEGSRWGVAGSVSATRSFGTLNPTAVPAAFVVQAGYKMRGYVEGDPLAAGPVIRAGIALALR